MVQQHSNIGSSVLGYKAGMSSNGDGFINGPISVEFVEEHHRTRNFFQYVMETDLFWMECVGIAMEVTLE